VIRRIATRGFRNLRELTLEPGAQLNVIYGDNGEGKSNVLEAIAVVAGLRSFRGASSADMVAHDDTHARIEASVQGSAIPHTLQVRWARQGGREVMLDGKRPRSHASYRASAPLVIFHPGDVTLVGGAPEQRRALLDDLLELLDPTYASVLAAYTKALRSRNRLLRDGRPSRSALSAYDTILAEAGAVIGQTRGRLTGDLAPRAQARFDDIVGGDGELSITYEPKVEPEPSMLREALSERLHDDLARGYTGAGPHADEVRITLGRGRARHHASQGEQRAIVLSLKLAEASILHERSGRLPMLLLDDVSSELDRARLGRLFDALSALGAQLFVTTTQPDLIPTAPDRIDYHVQQGVLTPQ
jgi:DNA replication and repair protein RecF